MQLFSLNLSQPWWTGSSYSTAFSCFLSQIGHLSEDNRHRNGQGEMKSPADVTLSVLLATSVIHMVPGLQTTKSIAILNNMWLMIGASFLSWSLVLLPKNKPLNVPKHFNSFSPLSLALRRAVFPLQIWEDQKRDHSISRFLQVVTFSWPIHSLDQGTIL
jgi:hypothetical protein